MHTEAESMLPSNRRSGQNLQYVSMRKHPSLAASCVTCSLPTRVEKLSNTSTETFLHCAAETEDPLSTPTQMDKAPEM